MSNKGSALVTNPVLENGGIGNQTTGHYHVGTLDINYTWVTGHIVLSRGISYS